MGEHPVLLSYRCAHKDSGMQAAEQEASVKLSDIMERSPETSRLNLWAQCPHLDPSCALPWLVVVSPVQTPCLV